MPKRKPALRPQQPQPAARKKAKQRDSRPLPPPPPIAFPTRPMPVANGSESASGSESATPVATPVRTPTSRLPGRDYAYVKRELQRIAMTATLIIVLLVVLYFVIP